MGYEGLALSILMINLLTKFFTNNDKIDGFVKSQQTPVYWLFPSIKLIYLKINRSEI